jgi:hypothetical protein
MTDFRKLAFVGLMGLGMASLACSSSGTTSGTGGTTGTGTGGSHTGGTTGTGTGGTGTGSGGTAGTAGSAGPACGTGTTAPPAATLITDFSDASGKDGGAANAFTFGTATTVQGGTTTFQNPASSPGVVTLSGGAVTYAATVSLPGTGGDAYPYSGMVVYINGPSCVDASQHAGVSFSIKGDLGTCGLVFSFNDAEHGAMGTADPRFTGVSGSYAPQYSIPAAMVTSTAATIMVPWTGPSGGSPATPVDPMNLTGVQWQLSNSNTATATCTGTITIDDVKFY